MKNSNFKFNDGRSHVIIKFSPINQAYLVWRQDGPCQGNVRVHCELFEAENDFNSRIDFIRKMGETK